MPTKNRNISHLIENQLPGFIADQYEDFSIFIEKYYQQLELTGQPLDIISNITCLLYTSPSPRDATLSRMPSSA